MSSLEYFQSLADFVILEIAKNFCSVKVMAHSPFEMLNPDLNSEFGFEKFVSHVKNTNLFIV